MLQNTIHYYSRNQKIFLGLNFYNFMLYSLKTNNSEVIPMKKTLFLLSLSTCLLTVSPTVFAADTSKPVSLKDSLLISNVKDGYETTASQISIIGACDPQYPLYVNDQLVPVTGNGYFVYYVTLQEGNNALTFVNHENKQTLNIKKTNFPCTNWGKDHEPTYGVIDRNYVTHRTNPDESDVLLTPLVKGTTAQIIGETSEYYKLSDGTFVYKETLELKKGTLDKNTISSISATPKTAQNCTEFSFNTTVNGLYKLEMNPEKAVLTLHDTSFKQVPENLTKDTIFNKVEGAADGDNAIYTFYLSEGAKCNGYYASYESGHLVVGFKNIPALENDSLKGATIVLDAGHGGAQPGALGPLGEQGPIEKEINLNITLSAKAYLENKGAKVLTIRNDDTNIGLTDRVNTILAEKPDLSISIHCNSMPITADYNESKGFLTFYTYNDLNNAIASMNQSICQAMNFNESEPRQSNLALTRLTNCPGVLFECGFMSNPNDYEWLVSPENQTNLGEAIGAAAEEYLLGLAQ